MVLAKEVSVRIRVTGYEDAKLKIDQITAAEVKMKAAADEDLTPKIDAAAVLAKARILRAGLKAEFDKAIQQKVDVQRSIADKMLSATGLGGSGIGGSGSGAAGLFGGLDNLPFGGLGGITAAIPAVGALLVEITALASGIAAGTAGLAAFGAVAYPTFSALKTGLTALSTATDNYQAASANLDIAIHKSPADFKAYQATIHGLEPDLQNAAKLLTNQNAVWQNLTPSMQKSLVALSNNSAALKLLLPSQKTALSALLAQKTAWDELTPSQQKAKASLDAIGASYQKITAALQPTVMKVFSDGLKVVANLLPTLKPFAAAAGTALDGLLKSLGKFTASSGFTTWIGQFSKLAGPAITAVGQGIGRTLSDLGKLFTSFSGKDVAHSINIVFDVINAAIRTLTFVVQGAMRSWDQLSSGMLKFASVVGPPILRFFSIVVGAVKILADAAISAFGSIIHSAALAFGWVPGLGGKLKTAAAAFDAFHKSVDSNLSTAQKNLVTWAQSLANVPKVAKIKADITDLQAKLKTAEASLNNPDVNGSRPKVAKIRADISQLEAAIAAAKAKLASLQNRTVTISVITSYSTIGAPSGPGLKAPGPVPRPKKRAAGGWTDGLTWVGEAGPELVYTPPGSYVYNNAQSQQMVSVGGSSNADVVNAIRALIAVSVRQNSITAGIPDGIGATLNGAARSAAYRALYNSRG